MVTPEWPGAREHLVSADKVMARLVAKVGRAPEFWVVDNAWEAIVRGIRHNLVGAEVAYKNVDNLQALFGGRFPTPHEIATTDPAALAKDGRMPPNHATAIVRIATAIDAQELDLVSMGALSDEELMRQLDALPGIGPWTAGMVMLFHYQRKDVIVTGDVGMRSAIRDEYKLPEQTTDKEVDAFIVKQARTKWSPFSSAAAYYLWSSHGAFVPGLSGVSLDKGGPVEAGAEKTAKPAAMAEASKKKAKKGKGSDAERA